MKLISRICMDTAAMYYCKQVHMLVSLTFCKRDRTNRVAQLLWPLVAMGPSDITECSSLVWPRVAMGSCDIQQSLTAATKWS
jgi:hypothetical protein